MATKRTQKKTSPELDKEAVSILKALVGVRGGATCKEVAEKTKMTPQKVAGKLRSLVNKELVEKTDKGTYKITRKARKYIS